MSIVMYEKNEKNDEYARKNLPKKETFKKYLTENEKFVNKLLIMKYF